MNHLEGIKSSRHVCTHTMRHWDIANVYGTYQRAITMGVFGCHEVRPRQGSLSAPWDVTSGKLFTPPNLVEIPDRLSDLLDQRAIEINDIANQQGKRIAIMWSGGIDSTAVLSSFIKNLSSQDLEKITIVLTLASIKENVNFYREYISNKHPCISFFDLDVTDEFLDKYILLHGDPGDCIFGPSVGMYASLLATNNHLDPWKDNIKFLGDSIETYFCSARQQWYNDITGFGPWYAKQVSNNLLEVQPPGIDSIADWWWWNYFNLKWEFSIWRPFFKTRKNHQLPISIANIESYVKTSYFNTDKFQLWSYSNRKTHIGNTRLHHKMEAKKYIMELDNNPNYFNNKTKVDSAPSNYLLIDLPIYYDENWVGHYVNEPGLEDTVIELLENFAG